MCTNSSHFRVYKTINILLIHIFITVVLSLLVFIGLKFRTSSIAELAEYDLGDRVIVAGQRKGTIRYCGETKFAPGKLTVTSSVA